MLETIQLLWITYPSSFLFPLIFISLLFLRPSKSYDFEAFLAVSFGIFIAYALQTTQIPAIQAFLSEFNKWSRSVYVITGLILLFIGIRQFSEKSFFYPNVLDNVIESPFGLFLLTLFLAYYNKLYFTQIILIKIPLLKSRFLMLFIQEIVFWCVGGIMITFIKNTLPESFLRKLFGIIVIIFGIVMLLRILPFPGGLHFYF